jgi:hypothetical protein
MPATLTAAAAAHAPGIGSYFWEGSMNKKIFDTEQQPQHTPQDQQYNHQKHDPQEPPYVPVSTDAQREGEGRGKRLGRERGGSGGLLGVKAVTSVSYKT